MGGRLLLTFSIVSGIIACGPISRRSFLPPPPPPNNGVPMPAVIDYDTPFQDPPVQHDSVHSDMTHSPPEIPKKTSLKGNNKLQARRRDTAPLPLEKKSRQFPSLFDLFRPLVLPTLPPLKNIFGPPKYSKSLGTEYFKNVPRAPSPFFSNPSFVLQCSPPISWTFCDPICGSGDQAVDVESSHDNALQDIREAVGESFTKVHLLRPREEDISLQYKPNSTMLEEFGNYYDREGYKYLINGQAVASRIHKNDTMKIIPFHVNVTVTVRYAMSISSLSARMIANKMFQYLSLHKGARFLNEIKVQ